MPDSVNKPGEGGNGLVYTLAKSWDKADWIPLIVIKDTSWRTALRVMAILFVNKTVCFVCHVNYCILFV